MEVSNAESSTEVVTLDITADDTTLVTPEIDGTPSSKEIANILPMNQLVTSPVDAAMQRMIDVCERLVPPWSEMGMCCNTSTTLPSLVTNEPSLML